MNYVCRLIDEDGAITVEFPDLPNVITMGKDHREAVAMATEALNASLASDVARGVLPPAPATADGTAIEVEPHIVTAIELRKLRGSLTQREVARRLEISYQAYQRLENPVIGNPTIRTLERAARALGKRLEVNFV